MAKKICPKCGADGKPTDKFCSKCGSRLVESNFDTTSENDKEQFNQNVYENARGNTNNTNSNAEGMNTERTNTNRETNDSSKFWYFLKHMWFRGFDGGEEETSKARYVSNPQSLEDRMKVIKNLYPVWIICFGIGFFVEAFLAIGLIGLILTYPIDVCMTEYQMYHLRRYKFGASQEMTDEKIFERVQPVMLSKYGLKVEKNENGQAVITINDFYYTIMLNPDSTFCIWWDAPLKRNLSIRLLRDFVYYKYYKEMLGAMGTIAYEVQAQFNITVDYSMGESQNNDTYNQQRQSNTSWSSTGQGTSYQSRTKFSSDFQNQKGQAKTGSASNTYSKQARGNWSQGSYNFNWSTITNAKTNWIAVVSSILMIICVFLPYVKVSVLGVVSSETLISGDGWFFIGIAIIALVFGVKGKDNGVMVMGIIAAALTFVEVINFSNTIDEMDFGYLLERGSGYYLMIASTIALVISGFCRKFMPQNNQ